MNYHMTSVGSRFAFRAGRRVSARVPAADLPGLVAYGAIIAALAFAISPIRYLLTSHLSVGTQVGGLALLAATFLCYLRVMFGALSDVPRRTQIVNLVTLTACTFVAPVPLDRSWLVLGFALPAAAASAIRWPTGLWLGLGALPAALATALALGQGAAAAGRATAQDAVVAAALSAVVMLAARAGEFGELQATVVTMTDAQASTEDRLRQANDLLDILGWRLSVIARMSDLIGQVSAQRPTAAGQVLADISRLAVDWPGEAVTGTAGRGDWEVSAEIEAVRLALAAAGIRGETSEVLADVPTEWGSLLALAVHEAARAMLRRPEATSCRIVAVGDASRVQLTVTGDGLPPEPAEANDPAEPDEPTEPDELAVLAGQVTAAGGHCAHTVTGDTFSLQVELPAAEPTVK